MEGVPMEKEFPDSLCKDCAHYDFIPQEVSAELKLYRCAFREIFSTVSKYKKLFDEIDLNVLKSFLSGD
jgi:hypothetical protein